MAETPQERRQGLMEVEELPEGLDGMLFVYDSPRSTTFTMLNTPMPLDIWWFDSSGVLVGSTVMEPCSAAPCTGYRSPGEIMWALETPQGRYEFGVGQTLSTG